MKITIKKQEAPKHFIQVPQRDSNIFEMDAHLFKFYVWLLSHNDGYKFTKYYLVKGLKTDYRRIETRLKKLQIYGWIELVESENEIIIKCKNTGHVTNSQLTTTGHVTNSQLTTTGHVTNSQLTTTTGQLTNSNSSQLTYSDSSHVTTNYMSTDRKNSSQLTDEVYKKEEKEEKQIKENQEKKNNQVEEIFSQVLDSDSDFKDEISFDINKIQDEIENYKPKYFLFNTQEYLFHWYNEFIKQVDKSITLEKFEKVLITKLYSQYQMEYYDKPIPTLPDILNYVKDKNAIQFTSDIDSHIQLMKKNVEWVTITLNTLIPQ